MKKASGIRVAPEHWLDDKGGLNRYVKGGRDGHPKAALLNNKLKNFKDTCDNMINEHLGEGNKIITEAALRAILNGRYQEHLDTKDGKCRSYRSCWSTTKVSTNRQDWGKRMVECEMLYEQV